MRLSRLRFAVVASLLAASKAVATATDEAVPRLQGYATLPEGAVLLDADSPFFRELDRRLEESKQRFERSQAIRRAARVLYHADAPERLEGRWEIALCASPGKHTWLRMQSLQTGEVVTISRYRKGAGGDPSLDGEAFERSKASRSGVWLNREVKSYGPGREHVLLTTVVADPVLYRGQGGGDGHHGIRNNCVTYTRNAWAFYTGVHYDLPVLHSPTTLWHIVRTDRDRRLGLGKAE